MRSLEWIIAIVSAFAVALLLLFLLYEGIWGERAEIAFAVSHAPAVTSANGHPINVRIENLGGRTASGVQVVGELRDGQQVVETGRFVLDFVPGHSHRGGTLMFQRDPAAYRLEVRIAGFTVP